MHCMYLKAVLYNKVSIIVAACKIVCMTCLWLLMIRYR